MKFYTSIHCTSESHCDLCRYKEGGRDWRQSIYNDFKDVTIIDFKCPKNKKWHSGDIREENLRKRTFLSSFNKLYNKIILKVEHPWLIAMAHQCKLMYDHPPAGMTCKNKQQFRNRWFKKLKYYRKLVITGEEVVIDK